jgi:xanthine dehydrogenase/oxidase
MGVGTWLTEEVTFDSTGKLTSNGTWDYKPPCTKDIPLEFNVTLLKNNPNIVGILGSKATAEPPMILSNSVHFALRRTIELARLDRGLSPTDAGTFVLNTPATAERVLDIIGTVPNKDFVLKM